MLKIAYCDDSENDRKEIEYALTKIQMQWEVEFVVCAYQSGEELLRELETREYDIVLLDIVMHKVDGIAVARVIRKKYPNCWMIFISNYEKRWKELLGRNTLAFLDKPICSKELESVLKTVCDEKKADTDKMFEYKLTGNRILIPVKEVLYWESEGHYVKMHTLHESIKYKGKISEVWEQLEHTDDVIRPTKSHIVNLRYMSMSKRFVKINGRIEIPIGRSFQQMSWERYNTYLNERRGS